MTDYIGQQFGNYQLLRWLGRGAFAEVYLAEHRYLEVPAAIKILRVRMEPTTHEQFRREAYTIAHLQHPHIVRVLDFGIQEQVPYLVMEYTPNGTLRTQYPKGTRVPFDQVVIYVKQIASALDYAHQHGVIHRDVKPENILLSVNHQVLLSDFGLAIVQRSMQSLSTQPQAGTPMYMAPEQIQGKPCAASDQYALGVLVYEWLCGEPPFRGSLYELWAQHLHQPPPALLSRVPQIPSAVEEVIFGALAKDPRQRFASVQDFAVVLEEACSATQPLPSRLTIKQQPSQQEIPSITLSLPRPPVSTARPAYQVNPALQSLATLPPPISHSHTSNPSVAERNRRLLLQRVRSFWIEGVLEHSLHGTALMALNLQEQPDAIINPWHLVLQHIDSAPRLLPGGTRITQVYDASGGELLILGAPGSGKTTLLLELARDLLARAEHDKLHPMPVVFNLSSWTIKQHSLEDWLVEELNNKYQIPCKLGQALVAAEQILPLLDGLDEVTPRDRTACIETINAYRQQHGLLPLVVCSRRADYLAQTTRIQLGTAVVVQPLTEQQIDDYLASGTEPLQVLRLALRQNAELRELARTPLMLSLLMLTHHGMSTDQLLRMPSLEARQRQVFERYIELMLTRRNNEKRYTSQQTTHWLSCLARQLTQHGQTVFYIERMQPGWLEDYRSQQRYPRVVAGSIFGLVAALCPGLAAGRFFAPSSSIGIVLVSILIFGLISGSLFGIMNGLLYNQKVESKLTGKRKWSWKRTCSRLVRGALNGWLVGLLVGVPYGLFLSQMQGGNQINFSLEAGAIIGILGGLVFLLIDSLLGIQTTEIRPVEVFTWSWIKMGRKLIKFFLAGVLAASLIALVFGLCSGIYHWWIGETKNILSDLSSQFLPSLWISALILAPLAALLGGLTGGLSSETLDKSDLIMPNQGIRRSARHGVIIGITGTLIGGLVGGLLTLPIVGEFAPMLFLIYALIFGPLIGLVSGLRAGGLACIQHFVLRWFLWRNESLPWNYSRFLDYAARRVLLRKVGGGYIFVHRLLLEYFASLETPPL